MAVMTVPEALRDRDLRRYPLRRRRIPVAGGHLSMVIPRSINDVLSEGHRSARIASGREPMAYWAELWPASIGIARAVMRGPALHGLRALDLGCGLGLAGTACAARGAAVVLWDSNPEALRFAAFNARQNAVNRSAEGADDNVTVHLGDWAQPLASPFDVVMLADVSYERRSHDPLLLQLRSALGVGAVAWHADPYRDEAGVFLERVRREFTVEESEVAVTFDGARSAIRLCRIERAG